MVVYTRHTTTFSRFVVNQIIVTIICIIVFGYITYLFFSRGGETIQTVSGLLFLVTTVLTVVGQVAYVYREYHYRGTENLPHIFE